MTLLDSFLNAFRSAEVTGKKRGHKTVVERAKKKATSKREKVIQEGEEKKSSSSRVAEILKKVRAVTAGLKADFVAPVRLETEEDLEEADEFEKVIQKDAWVNMRQGVRVFKNLLDTLKSLNEADVMLSGIPETDRDVEIFAEISKVEKSKAKVLQEIENFKTKNPEWRDLFYLYELRRLQDEGLKEIVSTSSTEDYMFRIRKVMALGQRGLLGGPTGAGKTVMAEMVARDIREGKLKAAQEAGDEMEVKRILKTPAFRKVVGSKNTQDSEIVGHDVVRVKEFTVEDLRNASDYFDMINKLMEEYVLEYQQKHGHKIPDELKAQRAAFYANLNPFGKGMETRFDMGPIYRCMEEGIPFILDEVNGLPPDVLLKLNGLMTAKIGDIVPIQENGGSEVKVREGFSIISTGNFGDLYKGRSALDLSFVNRIDKRIDVDYVPNATKIESELGDGSVFESELFLILISKWMSNSKEILRGGGMAEKDSMDVMWNFAKFIRRIQDISLGNDKGYVVEYRDGQNIKKLNAAEFIKNPISMREVLNILKDYLSGMGRGIPFENYLLEHIFFVPDTEGHNAEYIGNAKRAIYYDLLKQYGFFTRFGSVFKNFEAECVKAKVIGDGVTFHVNKKTTDKFWQKKSVADKLYEIQGSLQYLGGRALVHKLVGEPPMERDWEKLSGQLPANLLEEIADKERKDAQKRIIAAILKTQELLKGKYMQVSDQLREFNGEII